METTDIPAHAAILCQFLFLLNSYSSGIADAVAPTATPALQSSMQGFSYSKCRRHEA